MVLSNVQSESLTGKCTKLHTLAASNNRDHVTGSLSLLPSGSTINCSPGSQALLEVTHQDHSIGIILLLLFRDTYIWVLFFAHIPFVVNHTFNTMPMERLQQHEAKAINRTSFRLKTAFKWEPIFTYEYIIVSRCSRQISGKKMSSKERTITEAVIEFKRNWC